MLEITLPVLNEESRLERGTRELHEAMIKYFKAPLICIADNGSKDRTLEIAQNLSRELSGVRVVSTLTPGVGLALKTSWKSTLANWVGYVDVDHSTDLKHLEQVAQIIREQKFQVCTGTRLHEDSIVDGRSLKREISSRTFNWLLQEMLEVQFSDGMCGFKFLTRSLFEEIQSLGPLDDGWFFNTEILVKSEWLKKKVIDIPVHWTDDSDSRVKIFSLAQSYFKEMRRLRQEKPIAL